MLKARTTGEGRLTDIAKGEGAPNTTAKRFEYLGWAVFLLLAGFLAWFREDGDWWLVAAAGAMAFYVIAGWLLKFRVTLGLVFLAVALAVLAASRFTEYDIDLVPTLLIAGGVVLVLKAIKPS